MHFIINQAGTGNRLLAALSPADFGLLQPDLARKAVGPGEVLIKAGEPIESIYFPGTGLASFVSDAEAHTELGMVGPEGCIGVSIVLGVEHVPLNANGQIAGQGFAIPSSALLAALERSPSLRSVLGRYAHAFMMQVASTAYANAYLTIEQRLASWLLMCHDRSNSDDIPLTHDVLAVMLCVRRPGVTVATHLLEGVGAIRAKRGRITIRDRDKLINLAGDSYGIAEAEYDRFFAPVRRPIHMQAAL